MKRLFFLNVLLILCLGSYSQNTKKVRVTGWIKNNNRLLVGYYVIDGNESEVYELTIDFFDINKTKLLAFAISGDFPRITGGDSKKLYWDVLKDRQDFPYISDVKIYIKTVEANTDKIEQNIQNKPFNVDNTASEQKIDDIKPNESGDAKSQNISKEKRRLFTIGVYGGYGIVSIKEFDVGYINFKNARGGEIYYGGFLSIGHLAMDVSKTERNISFYGDPKYPTSDINSINASFDFYSDMPASPKQSLAILLGFGVGSYSNIYTNDLGIETVLRRNEIAFFPKAGIFIQLTKHLKLSLIDTYHFTTIPMNDFNLVFSLNL